MSGVGKTKGIRVNSSETVMYVHWDWTIKKMDGGWWEQGFHCWSGRLHMSKKRRLE